MRSKHSIASDIRFLVVNWDTYTDDAKKERLSKYADDLDDIPISSSTACRDI